LVAVPDFVRFVRQMQPRAQGDFSIPGNGADAGV
jgi:hypothetical protein